MAGLVTITTPVAGTLVSTTTFGIPVATNAGVIANPPVAKMRNSAGVSIAVSGTAQALTWDTEDYDTVGGHSTTTNTSRYVAQAGYAGYYQCSACAVWTGNATGVRVVFFEVNGTGVAGSAGQTPASASITTTSSSVLVFLNAGDFVEAWAQQTSGGALSTVVSSTSLQSVFTVEWVHQNP